MKVYPKIVRTLASFLNNLREAYSSFIRIKEKTFCSFLFLLLGFSQIIKTALAVDRT